MFYGNLLNDLNYIQIYCMISEYTHMKNTACRNLDRYIRLVSGRGLDPVILRVPDFGSKFVRKFQY